MTGFGIPYEGTDFTKEGSSRAQLGALDERLAYAFPDNGWQGVAAQAYSDQVLGLQTAIAELKSLDWDLAREAHRSAIAVCNARLVFGLLKDLLLVAHVCEIENKELDLGYAVAISISVLLVLIMAALTLYVTFAIWYVKKTMRHSILVRESQPAGT